MLRPVVELHVKHDVYKGECDEFIPVSSGASKEEVRISVPWGRRIESFVNLE